MSNYEADKSRSIAISVGINAAATMAAGTKDPLTFFNENVEAVVAKVFDTHETYAEFDISQAFPGTAPVAPAVPFVPPTTAAPQAAPAPAQAAPAAIPGVQDGDPVVAANWQRLFHDKTHGLFEANWYDNRKNKKSPNGPDFKLKADQDVALWIADRFKKNPSWVPAALASTGLG